MSHEDVQETLLEPLTSIHMSRLSQDPEQSPRRPRSPSIDANSNQTSHVLACVGLGVSILFGLFCFVSGIVIVASKIDTYPVILPSNWPGGYPKDNILPGMAAIFPDAGHHLILPELIRFAFTIMNTICTDAIGFVHAVTQRSTLALTTVSPVAYKSSIGREKHALRFNTNLRFFTVPESRDIGSFHPNGSFLNLVMALLLILSYASISLSFLEFTAVVATEPDDGSIPISCTNTATNDAWQSICVFAAPLLILGICILLKAAIAIAGLRRTRILLWSSSPLDTTAAVIVAGQVSSMSGRCMYSVLDNTSPKNRHSQDKSVPPKKPSSTQPSAWQSHRNIRRVVKALWVLVISCGAWGGIIIGIWHSDKYSAVPSTSNYATPGLESWSFIPTDKSNALVFGPSCGSGPIPVTSWVICFIVLIVVQGALTMALHCCELIINVLRDENTWRKATTRKGTKPINSVKAVGAFWPSVALQVAKPILHWMFGFCLSLRGTIAYVGVPDKFSSNDDGLTQASLQVIMRSVQTWYLMVAFAIFTGLITFLAISHPKGPQPAAYGHVQTLANLIDNWAPDMTMWWGHKERLGEEHHDENMEREIVHHAGTSDNPLPLVSLDYLYG
ncbi:hypothetical protein M422DRAFT_248937 [Sphaerobolus stellatus SS14]|nr:hypothetical protein M422DRAFT_248937 [Sphaerobolus stellatus SS14]